jgi:hypothetical protein
MQASLEVHVSREDNAFMKRSHRRHLEGSVQLTVRGVPLPVALSFKREALREDKSLNTVLVEALCKEAGASAKLADDDLHFLVGTWEADPVFDAALRSQHRIDARLWK